MKLMLSIVCFLIIFSSGLSSCIKEQTPGPRASDTLTLYLRPGPNDGRDVIVSSYDDDGGAYGNVNNMHNPDLSATRWTFNSVGAGLGTFRSYIKFSALYGLPDKAIIQSAKLSLFGVSVGDAAPQGNSYYPGSPYYSYGDNKSWLKRVIENWNERTITWNNKPATTDENQVEVPASTSQFNSDAIDLDVTKLVQDMLDDGKKTAGFCLQLQNEQIYRSVNFASSRYADPAKRPTLIVKYTLGEPE
ncbi:MAG: DNRLRE domain-containing protein [Chitinophagaceae bacterium]|nr:DNRLRE domain-containing protein [Chitinophagaceae bacterium]